MANKKDEMIIDPKDFPIFLAGRFPGGRDAIMAGLGVGPKLVYLLTEGKRKPSAAILKKCGLEIVYRAALPEKVKK